MDVVLEVFDTFIGDFGAAWLTKTLYPSTSTSAFAPNGTFSSLREVPTSTVYTAAQWEYKPSTEYFSITPYPVAYESRWARDDWRRQFVSLYLITWYALYQFDGL